MNYVRLGEVATIVARLVDPTLPQYSGLALYNGENVESGTRRLLYRRTASDERAISRKYEVAAGDVLYSKLRPYLRKVIVAAEAGLCSADMYPLRVRPELADPDWLAWLLLSDGFTRYANQASARARMPKLNQDQLFAYRFELPPIDDQRRIAADLANQLAAVDSGRAASMERHARAKQLRSRIVRDAIPRPPDGPWPWVPLDEAAQFLDGMRRPVSSSERARRTSGKSADDLYPYFGANGQAGWIDDFLFDEPLVLLAEDGGAFGSESQSIAYRVDGKVWVNNHAHVLRPRDHVNVDFLRHAIGIRPDVGGMISGSTRGKLNKRIAASILVPIPPITTQRRIVVELDARLSTIDLITSSIEAEWVAIERLRLALLRQAFVQVVG